MVVLVGRGHLSNALISPGDMKGNAGLLVPSINEILCHSWVPDLWRKPGLLEKAWLVFFVVDAVLDMDT